MCFLLVPLYDNFFIISFSGRIFNYGICDKSRKEALQKRKWKTTPFIVHLKKIGTSIALDEV